MKKIMLIKIMIKILIQIIIIIKNPPKYGRSKTQNKSNWKRYSQIILVENGRKRNMTNILNFVMKIKLGLRNTNIKNTSKFINKCLFILGQGLQNNAKVMIRNSIIQVLINFFNIFFFFLL
jgi:hypothetical protein